MKTTKSVIRVIKKCALILQVRSAGSLLLFLLNVCVARGDGDAFSPPIDPSEQNLAAAILSGDLAAVKRNAADQFDVEQKKELKAFVLNYGTGEVVRYLNSHAQLGIEDLQIAVIESDLEAIKRLVPKQARRSPFHGAIDAHTPLRLAVRRGKVSVVKLLLDLNVPANEYLQMFQPGNGFSVLSEAIRQGNAEIVQLLIAADVAIEEDSSTFVPVENAIYKGKPVDEILKSFQTRFFAEDVDYKRLAEEKKAILQELLEIGLVGQIRIPEANANCPLAEAIHAGRAKVVAAILEGGANPNISIGEKTRPLHAAVRSGNPSIVKLLIDAGADVNKRDANGDTPLSLGFYKGDIADLLRASGANEPLGSLPQIRPTGKNESGTDNSEELRP